MLAGVREHGQSRIASNLFRYAWRTLGIIFSFIRDYSPGTLFNAVTTLFFVLSTAVATFFLWHRVTSGTFSPHIWAGFVAAFFLGLSLMSFGLGQVALMVSRLRSVQERQLYLVRRHLPQIEGEGSHAHAP